MKDPLDFYKLLAKHWNIDRKEAKLRILSFYPLDYSYSSESQMQPEVLAFIPSAAREELLEYYDVKLGSE